MPRLRSPLRFVIVASVFSLGCSAPTGTGGVSLRLKTSVETAAADPPFLYLEGEIVNASNQPFTSGGCTRPAIEIDSLSPTGTWGEITTTQPEELILCIRAFTVDPGSTAGFASTKHRPGIGTFPKGRRLRARIPVGESRTGPTAEFVLPP